MLRGVRIYLAGRRQCLHLFYATFGEFVAWIIGWDLILEFAVGAAVVAKGWSSYLGTVFGFAGGTMQLGAVSFDWGALLIIVIVSTLLTFGTKLSSHFSAAVTAVKVTVVVLVVVVGAFYIKAANFSRSFRPPRPVRGLGHRHRPVCLLAADRGRRQPLRLVRRSCRGLDRVLRLHRFRHRCHYCRGDP